MNSLEKLKDYANIKDDWYLKNLIYYIEQEIKIVQMEAKIEVYKETRHDNTEHRAE